MTIDGLIGQVPGWLVHPGPGGVNLLGALAGVALALAIVAICLVSIRGRTGRTRTKASLQAEDYFTFLAALMATWMSVDGMWRVAGERLGMRGPERFLLCAFMEVALVACALRARRNVREFGKEGLDGYLVWIFAVLTGFYGASVGTGIGAVVRFCAPLVAAVLWQRGLNLLRRRVRPEAEKSIAWRWTTERLAIWLGFAEPAERTTTDVARARRIARLIKVRIALAALDAEPSSRVLALVTARGVRKAVVSARLRNQSIAAVEHLRLGMDPDVMEQISRTTAAVVNLPALTDPRAVVGPPPAAKPPPAARKAKPAKVSTGQPVDEPQAVPPQRVAASEPDKTVVTERVGDLEDLEELEAAYNAPDADEPRKDISDRLAKAAADAPTTKEAIQAMRVISPKVSQGQMARILGIKRQAVSQALQRLALASTSDGNDTNGA
jgi:hypothetical protein